jgi:predicted O-methyltransferase YrrM
MRSLQGPPERQQYFLPVVRAAANGAEAEILEVGSWAGASTISWASALRTLGLRGNVTCVDAWLPYFSAEKERAGHYQRMNRAAEHGMIYKLFQHNVSCSGFDDTIVARRGRSSEILPNLPAQSFHVIYLDGSHALEDVLFDVRQAKRLLRPGGIVCGDDLEIQLSDLDPVEVETAALSRQDYVLSSNGSYYHPGVTLAVAQEFGNVRSWSGFWAVRSAGGDWGPVSLDLTDSEVPQHIASAALKIEGDIGSHYLISCRDRYFALAKELGPPDIVAEVLGDEDVPPVVFTGATLEAAQAKVEEHRVKHANHVPADGELELYTSPFFVGSYRGFNLVRLKRSFYGLRQTLGVVDAAVGDAVLAARYRPDDVIIGDSPQAVKARIDAVEAERTVDELTARLQELNESGVKT